MPRRGFAGLTLAIMMLIITLFSVVVTLRSQDPLQRPETKALQFAEAGSSLLNSMSLVDEGRTELNFKDLYNVKVSFDEGHRSFYFSMGHRKFEGTKSSPIYFYPTEKDSQLERDFNVVDKICIIKTRGKRLAEVERC